jgi:hypothetical protein
VKRISLLVVLMLTVGGGAFLAYRAWHRSASATDNRIPPANLHREVSLRFLECARKHAVFVLENGTDRPIYARVHRADFWQDFKDANLQFGLHQIEYRPSSDAPVEDLGPMFDAIDNFRPVMPNEVVRYGVVLRAGPGEYTVTVPYMEDAEIARRLNEEWPAVIETDFARVKASWRHVSSGVVTTTCR